MAAAAPTTPHPTPTTPTHLVWPIIPRVSLGPEPLLQGGRISIGLVDGVPAGSGGLNSHSTRPTHGHVKADRTRRDGSRGNVALRGGRTERRHLVKRHVPNGQRRLCAGPRETRTDLTKCRVDLAQHVPLCFIYAAHQKISHVLCVAHMSATTTLKISEVSAIFKIRFLAFLFFFQSHKT